MVTLSDTGTALRSEVVQVPQKITAQAGEIFTVEEAVTLRSLLNKLLDAIDLVHGVENPEDSIGKK